MQIKSIAIKGAFLMLALLSCLFSLACAGSLIVLIFNFDDKNILYSFLGTLVLTVFSWAFTFFVANLDKNKTKKEKIEELKTLFVKLPLILASSVITSFYVLIYFFFFAFITVSKYGDGGWGADVGTTLLLVVFTLIGISIFGIVMYKVFKTDKQDMTLTLYNQFTVLKWSSLIALFFGIWSTYYFYHDQGGGGYVAMFIWDLILYGIYKLFSRLSNRAQESITDSNVNRILHEKKKEVLKRKEDGEKTDNHQEQNTTTNTIGIADEIQKLKQLLDDKVITEIECETQKNKLLK